MYALRNKATICAAGLRHFHCFPDCCSTSKILISEVSTSTLLHFVFWRIMDSSNLNKLANSVLGDSQLTNVDYILVGVALAVVLCCGLYHGIFSGKSRYDFFVGGRAMRTAPVAGKAFKQFDMYGSWHIAVEQCIIYLCWSTVSISMVFVFALAVIRKTFKIQNYTDPQVILIDIFSFFN